MSRSMFRRAGLAVGVAMAALALLVVGGCQVRPCKRNTALFSITFAGAALEADSIAVQLSVAGAEPQVTPVAHKPGEAKGGVEIDFAAGYPEGAELAFTLTALRGTEPLAMRADKRKLEPTCTALALTLGASGAPKAQGSACDPLNDTCASGFCVDGFCCDSVCGGQCQACDVTGAPGVCSPVMGAPHTGRAACVAADASCGGSCDGASVDACVYPTTACGAASCSAGMFTAPGSCSAGACVAAAPRACALGACDGMSCDHVTQVSAGDNFTCALSSLGSVWCWGGNSRQQLGQGEGDTTARRHPTRVAMAAPALELATGTEGHTCALTRERTVQCWGDDNAGQLGRGTLVNASGKPDYVVAFVGAAQRLGTIATLAAGYDHSCAIYVDKAAVCWGAGDQGQCGGGDAAMAAQQSAPLVVCPIGTTGSCAQPATNLAAVASGQYHSCWVTTTGGVACSGVNLNGVLAQPSSVSRTTSPVAVTLPAGYVARSIASHRDGTCVVGDAQLPLCWGNNAQGQLGRVAAMAQPTPSEICKDIGCSGRIEGVKQVAMGAQFGCALIASDGSVRCWGRNNLGQLGDGGNVDKAFAGSAMITGASGITAGDVHACAITGPEEIRCWGDDTTGQLGDDDATSTPKSTPVAVKW